MCRTPLWFKDGREGEEQNRLWEVARIMTANPKSVSFNELAITL
jgi:hypothetical protein